MSQAFVSVGEGCFRVEGWANGYVITAGQTAVAVDAPPGDWVDNLDQIGVDRVSHVLATHHHRDTLAGAAGLVERGAKLVAPAGEVDLIADARNFWQTARTYVLYNCDSKFTALTEDIPVAQGVVGGDTLDVDGLSVEVVALPGHTRDGVGYVIEIAGQSWLFCGDAMSTPGCVHNWHDFHWDYMDFNTGHRALREALVPIRAKTIDRIAPAHAPVIEDAAGALELLDANLGQFVDAVEPNRISRPHDEMRQVSDHVYFLGMTTYAIVSDTGKIFLWDFGYVADTRNRLARLMETTDATQVDVLSMSHFHDDHTLRIAEIAYALGKDHTAPRSEIWCHQVLHDVLTRPHAWRLPCLIASPMPIDRVLGDESFMWEGIEMAICHMPGQTYWHAGLIVKVDGKTLAFTGDDIWKPADADRPFNGPIIARNRYLPGCGHDLIASHLIGHNVDTICPAHGDTFEVTPTDLQGYADWADNANAAIGTLAGHNRLGVDCWWCRIDPFHIYAKPGERIEIDVVIDSPFDKPTNVTINLTVPDGFTTTKTVQNTVHLAPGQTESVRFAIDIPTDIEKGTRLPILADLTVDGQYWGQLAEGLLLL